MAFASLQPLADRAALFAAVRQEALVTATDALGDYRWGVDDAPGGRTLTFVATADSSRRLVTRAHLVATIAPGPRSLLWAWAHPQGDPDGVAAPLRDYGAQHGIADLAQPEVPFPPEADADLDDWIADAAHQIGAVVAEITGRAPYYSAPVGGGTRAVFVLDAPLPPPTVTDAMIVLPRLLQSVHLSDARGAVWDLARLAGWHLEWSDEAFSGAVVRDASGSATFRFDAQARITGIDATLAR